MYRLSDLSLSAHRDRGDVPFYNIHIPRSGGTSICNTFRANLGDDAVPHHFVWSNCNLRHNNGFYLDGLLQSCSEQYRLSKEANFSMIARESPMFGHLEEGHPILCDEFEYIFSFRNIEQRIESMFRCNSMDIVNRSKGMMIGMFSESITRWFGWDQWAANAQRKGVWLQYFECLRAEYAEIDEIHFQNAVQYLLGIDHVLIMDAHDPGGRYKAQWDRMLRRIRGKYGMEREGVFEQWSHSGSEWCNEEHSMLKGIDDEKMAMYTDWAKHNAFDHMLFELARLIADIEVDLL